MTPDSLFDSLQPVSGWIAGLNALVLPYTNDYFQWLHELLPGPFFHTQGFLAFFLVVPGPVLGRPAQAADGPRLAAGRRQLPLLRRLERELAFLVTAHRDPRLPARPVRWTASSGGRCGGP